MPQTHSIHLADIKVGMVLSQDVINKATGEVLLRKDVTLDEKALARLQKYLSELNVYSQNTMVSLANPNEPLPDTTWREPEVLSESDRENFNYFKNSYAVSESQVKDYLNAIDEGKPIILNDLYQTTKNIFDGVVPKSKVFSFLNYLRDQDDYTYSHCINVSLLSNVFASWLSLSEQETIELTSAGMLIDIGKMRINSGILNKQGKLSPTEYEQIKMHTVYGYEMLESQNISQSIKDAVLQHHERIDGSGYPDSLTDKQIGNYAKILAICDIYEAMVSNRPYRKKISPFEVIREFERSYLGRLDTKYLMVFLKNIAYHYLNRKVRLSNGQVGEVIFIDSNNYSCPLIQLEDKSYLDLNKNKLVSIVEVL